MKYLFILLVVIFLVSVFAHPGFVKSGEKTAKSRVDATLSEALEGLKPHKKVNPNPPPPQPEVKPKRQNRPIPKPTTRKK